MGNNFEDSPEYTFKQQPIPRDKFRNGTLKNRKCLRMGDANHTELWIQKDRTKQECELIKELYKRKLTF